MQVKNCIAELGAASYMISEVKTLLTLFYVIPGSSASCATAERSFSALRRIKNYLRMTMTSQRLNSVVVVMNVHRELTDALDITAVETALTKTYLGDWMPSRWDYMYS